MNGAKAGSNAQAVNVKLLNSSGTYKGHRTATSSVRVLKLRFVMFAAGLLSVGACNDSRTSSELVSKLLWLQLQLY